MSDLISRQAAIDAVYKSSGTGTALKALKALPSAQPQQTCEYWDNESEFCALCRPSVHPQPEIIRCKDCKHRDPEDKKCDCGHDILWQLPRDDDWFCADAERREEQHEHTD